jgi:hypothetical protein
MKVNSLMSRWGNRNMLIRYPAPYQDASSQEVTGIENDGKTLRMVVRGVEFAGETFDLFQPVTGPES